MSSDAPLSAAARRPADEQMLDALLDELGVQVEGDEITYHLLSTWAAKHVWRLDIDGEPYAFIRYLLGDADQFPDRWRFMRLAELLHQSRVGPRVFGITPSSEALGGRAAYIEAALFPLMDGDLTARAGEALELMARLHSSRPISEALVDDLTDLDRQGASQLTSVITETRERWFNGVSDRWLACGLHEIHPLMGIVGEFLNRIQTLAETRHELDLLVPCHNDPNLGNFMQTRKGTLRLIDFETLALNNPVADVGVFLNWFVNPIDHRDLLARHYPVAPASVVIDHMQVWVPLRYLNLAAHWAARLTRADGATGWGYGVQALEQWMWGTAQQLYSARAPMKTRKTLKQCTESLLSRPWPIDGIGRSA